MKSRVIELRAKQSKTDSVFSSKFKYHTYSYQSSIHGEQTQIKFVGKTTIPDGHFNQSPFWGLFDIAITFIIIDRHENQ